MNTFESHQQDIKVRLKQHYDMALKRQQTLVSSRSFLHSSSQLNDAGNSSRSMEQEQLLDQEELKVRGEIDFIDKVIQER